MSVNDLAAAAGFGAEPQLSVFHRGYTERGRFGMRGEGAGVVEHQDAYEAGVRARQEEDMAEAHARQEPHHG